MKRLTTNNPKNNTEMMLNMVFIKDKWVHLRRLGEDGSDINLVDYCKKECSRKCINHEDYSDLEDFEEMLIDCDCSVSVLYWACVGFARVRERLVHYEDEAEKIMMTCSKPCHMGKDIKLVEREYNEGHEPYGEILAQYERQLEECPKICSRYKSI